MAASRKPPAALPEPAALPDPLGAGAEASAGGLDASGTVASGQSEHALLAAGKIDVEQFMDMTVDRALAHLGASLSPQRMELMREVLRSQLEQDPHLSSLVEQATTGS